MAISDQVKQAVIALAEKNNGVITPEELVSVASDPSHPAHDQFEWDNNEAARRYRIVQAAKLISSIRIEVPRREYIPAKPIPIFIKHPADASYLTIDKMRGDEAVSRAAAMQYFSKAQQSLRKAVLIAEALGLTEELEQTISSIAELAKRFAGGPPPPSPM